MEVNMWKQVGAFKKGKCKSKQSESKLVKLITKNFICIAHLFWEGSGICKVKMSVVHSIVRIPNNKVGMVKQRWLTFGMEALSGIGHLKIAGIYIYFLVQLTKLK